MKHSHKLTGVLIVATTIHAAHVPQALADAHLQEEKAEIASAIQTKPSTDVTDEYEEGATVII